MKRLTKLALIGAAALVVVGSISACGHHRDPEQRAQWMVQKVTKKLELNDAQQAKLKALSDEMLNARKAMKQEFKDDREQVLALLDQRQMDQDKMLGMTQSHTQTVNAQAPKIVAAMAGFYDSLTLEQQAKIRTFVAENHGHGPWGHHD